MTAAVTGELSRTTPRLGGGHLAVTSGQVGQVRAAPHLEKWIARGS